MNTARDESAAATREEMAGLPPTLRWVGQEDGWLRILDQTLLPVCVEYRDCRTAEEVWEAIRVLRVRGAPAIGVAAAYGLCLGTRADRTADRDGLLPRVQRVAEYLRSCRPTAVNLGWALDRLLGVARAAEAGSRAIWARLLEEAHAIAREDAAVCRKIGEHGAALVPDGGGVITHCNAGALATSAWGTALAALYVAHEQGKRFRAFADETRPLLQGARLTSFELHAAGIDVTVLCDGAAASLMKAGRVQMAIVGADRIAANGDAANKIGTYGLAIAAKHHGIPFYVAAPLSTFDLTLASGAEIPIEERPDEEISHGFGKLTVPIDVRCWNPAFDVTPAGLITGLVTERGLAQPVTPANVAALFDR